MKMTKKELEIIIKLFNKYPEVEIKDMDGNTIYSSKVFKMINYTKK